jgi:hypothetical protein
MPPVAAPAKHRTPIKETPAYKLAASKAQAAMERARKYRTSLVEKRVPDALMGAGASAGGAIVYGVIKGITSDRIYSIPMGVPLAILGTLIAVPSGLMGAPLGVHAGAGLVIPALADITAMASRGALGAVMGVQNYSGALAAYSEWKQAA